MSDLYKYLNAKKGKAYLDDQIKLFSLISLYPDIDTSRKLRGNSRTTGDVDKNIQDTIIDMIITIAVHYGLSYKEISYILLTTKVESGFNPDAAAGTTSAAGLAQGAVGFIKDTLTQSEEILGFQFDPRDMEVFDAEKGCYAIIYSFLLNKSKVMESYTSDQSEYWEWLYLLHHDGAYDDGKYRDDYLSYAKMYWKEILYGLYDRNKEKDLSVLAYKGKNADIYQSDIEDTRSVILASDPKNWLIKDYRILPPEDSGDGTVPVQAAKFTGPGLKGMLGVEVSHEGAYKKKGDNTTDDARLFTLRSIIKIAQEVNSTTLVYK